MQSIYIESDNGYRIQIGIRHGSKPDQINHRYGRTSGVLHYKSHPERDNPDHQVHQCR